jgi:hypothetical protein
MGVRSVTSRFACLAVVLSLGVAACESATSPQFELATARARWASVQPAGYSIIVTRICDCSYATSGPVMIQVRNGTVVSRVYVESGAVVADGYAEIFPNVDGLFALIDAGEKDGVSPVTAQFDPVLGYPTRVAVGDPNLDAPLYTVSAFHAQ